MTLESSESSGLAAIRSLACFVGQVCIGVLDNCPFLRANHLSGSSSSCGGWSTLQLVRCVSLCDSASSPQWKAMLPESSAHPRTPTQPSPFHLSNLSKPNIALEFFALSHSASRFLPGSWIELLDKSHGQCADKCLCKQHVYHPLRPAFAVHPFYLCLPVFVVRADCLQFAVQQAERNFSGRLVGSDFASQVRCRTMLG